MKKNLTIVLLLLTTCLLAQSPQSFKYQALLRDKNGILIMDKNVSVRIGILQGSVTGTNVYSETHAVKTSTSGTINLEIGKGSLTTGTFTSINWGKNSFFVKIEMDPAGGNAFELVGTSQLLSVPYALYAEKSGDEKWAINNNDIYYNAGQVSIGTVSQASRSSLYIDTPLPTSDNNKSNGLFINATDVSSRGIPLWIRSNTSNLTYSVSPGGTLGRFLRFHDLRFSQDGMWDFGIDQNNSLYIMGGSNGDITEKFTVKSNGNVGIGTITPASKLDVSGGVNATQFLLNGAPINFSSGQPLQWGVSGSNLFYSTGKVGLGVTNPTVKLDIDGGSDLDVLNLRNSNNSLGINASVYSTTDFHGSALIGRRARGTYASPSVPANGDRITGIYGSIYANNDFQNAGAVHMYVGPNPGSSSYPVNIRFETTNTNETIRTERMRITENGTVKVTTNDVYISNVGSGVIMKSPNGGCWRMTVSNTGTPVFTAVTCPQ